MAVPAIVPKVGLQLLLEPRTSSVAFRAACGMVGALYPAYATCKLVESKAPLQSAETRKWLKYWVIYGGLSVLENSTDKLLAWFPYYYHAKFAFLMWLQLYQTQGGRTGADYLYHKYVQPGLRKYQCKIDICLEHLYSILGAVYAVYRVPIQTGMAMATEAAKQAHDFITWFTSDDGSQQQQGPPAAPPSLGASSSEASTSSSSSSRTKPKAT